MKFKVVGGIRNHLYGFLMILCGAFVFASGFFGMAISPFYNALHKLTADHFYSVKTVLSVYRELRVNGTDSYGVSVQSFKSSGARSDFLEGLVFRLVFLESFQICHYKITYQN